MSDILESIRSSGIIPEADFDAALRRQQIYGGSFDTVVLELDLVDPAMLNKLLERGCGLPSAPVDLLEIRADRPWDAIPMALLDLGWVMPLASRTVSKREKIHVAVHPELPDERLALLRRSLPGATIMVTPECCLAQIAAERSGSLVPQRYAVLALTYIQALHESASQSEPPSAHDSDALAESAAPWMTAQEGQKGHENLPLSPSPHNDVDHELRPAESGFKTTAHAMEWDPACPPTAMDVDDLATHQDQGDPVLPPPPRETPDCAGPQFSEALQLARSSLDAADGRDTITDALLAGGLVIGPRCALFGVKREGLRGLAGPGSLAAHVTDRVVVPDSELESVINGDHTCHELTASALGRAVMREQPLPCILLPVKVGPRPVLMLYIDRDGQSFTPEDRAAAQMLCELAGQRLTALLEQLRNKPERLPATNFPRLVNDPLSQRNDTLVTGHQLETHVHTFTASPVSSVSPVSPMQPLPGIQDSDLSADELTTKQAVQREVARIIEEQAQRERGSTQDVPLDIPPIRADAVVSEVISLSNPLMQTSSRGKITIDKEDRLDPQRHNPDSLGAQIDSVIAAVERGDTPVSALFRFGSDAMQRVAARFPGEIDVLRRDMSALPPLSAHGALLRVVVQLGDSIATHIVELMDHPSSTIRFYAAFVFQELRHDRCLAPLSELAFDPEIDVRAIAMRVLETYSDSNDFELAAAHVRRELESPNRTRQLHAARAVGVLRDVLAVPLLLELLSSSDPYIRTSALESLCSVTGQQLGLKTHRWRTWFVKNASKHRIEWIMSSLEHRDISVRRWAADELRRVTGQSVNFPAAGSQPARAEGLKNWTRWWETVGQGRFLGG